MTVSQHMARARGRLAHHAHHAHHRHRCRGLDAREGKPEARVDRRVATAVVETPSGPEAADAALAWLAREFVWQSTLERLGARSGS